MSGVVVMGGGGEGDWPSFQQPDKIVNFSIHFYHLVWCQFYKFAFHFVFTYSVYSSIYLAEYKKSLFKA